ncbi:MAG: prephenate dehydratase [Betaproteobacteria bacterium]|nr:prephenate dehydratase [Betaproteobacteria bacterium]
MDSLTTIRRKIDALDAQLVKLFSARAKIAQQVGKIKNGKGIYRADREAQVLRRVSAINPGPLPASSIRRIYVEIMSACRALEDKMTVGYLGPQGTFSQEAAIRHFGGAVTTRSCATIDEVFKLVETAATGYGVVPVENSTEGAIGRTLDLLLATPATVCGEIMLPVQQCLMSKAKNLKAVKKVYSHAQSLGQCQRWLARHLPGVEQVAVVSNAEAAVLASRDAKSAALASRTAAQIYKLNLLARNVQDESRNITRFLVLSREDVAPSGRDKTSLILSARNVPGAMQDLLTPLKQNDVSMTRLESRPARTGRWDYVFYLDIEGHVQDKNVARALAAIERKATFVKILGSYPATFVR